MIEITVPIEDAAKWMIHAEFSRNPDGGLRIRWMKQSGEDYGWIDVPRDRMIAALDILGCDK